MSVFLQLLRKELSVIWFSPFSYAAWAVFLFVAGLNMWRMLAVGVVEPALSQGSLMFGSTLFWFGLLALITALTAPLLAEESRSGALETLLSAPVTDTAVVLAKFAAAWFSLLLMILPILAYLPIASAMSFGGDDVDFMIIAAGMLMLGAVVAAYAAFGLFVSALTRWQALVAVLTFSILSLCFFVENLLPLLRHPWARTFAVTAAAAHQVVDAARGIVDIRPITFYVTMAAWFLFASIKTLESRHWR